MIVKNIVILAIVIIILTYIYTTWFYSPKKIKEQTELDRKIKQVIKKYDNIVCKSVFPEIDSPIYFVIMKLSFPNGKEIILECSDKRIKVFGDYCSECYDFNSDNLDKCLSTINSEYNNLSSSKLDECVRRIINDNNPSSEIISAMS